MNRTMKAHTGTPGYFYYYKINIFKHFFNIKINILQQEIQILQ